MLDVEVQYEADDGPAPDAASIRRWVAEVMRGRREAAELTVRVVGLDEMRRLNSVYRQRDKPTNVLSFPADLPAELGLPLLGDIVICAAVVAEQARAQGKPGRAHWAHMVVHGALHLLGYDHNGPQEAQRMESLEIEILARLGFPDPYQDELKQ